MSTGPELIRPEVPEERNWLPLLIAVAVVVVVAGVAIFVMSRGKHGQEVAAPNAPLAAYASSLTVSDLAMSQSSNMAGSQLLYVEGRIRNTGPSVVTAVGVQVLFRNYAHEVAQNVSQPLLLIRTREPYVDVQPVSAAPIQPGEVRSFRLTFDGVTPNWDGAYPEIRILRVETK